MIEWCFYLFIIAWCCAHSVDVYIICWLDFLNTLSSLSLSLHLFIYPSLPDGLPSGESAPVVDQSQESRDLLCALPCLYLCHLVFIFNSLAASHLEDHIHHTSAFSCAYTHAYSFSVLPFKSFTTPSLFRLRLSLAFLRSHMLSLGPRCAIDVSSAFVSRMSQGKGTCYGILSNIFFWVSVCKEGNAFQELGGLGAMYLYGRYGIYIFIYMCVCVFIWMDLPIYMWWMCICVMSANVWSKWIWPSSETIFIPCIQTS